jgi:signal transduction histidine kinase
MSRLYLQIYLTFVGILVLFSVLAASALFLFPHDGREHDVFSEVGTLLGETLPGPDRPRSELQQRIEVLAERFNADFAVYDGHGRPLAATGAPLPPPELGQPGGSWIRGDHAGSFPLPDGRWVVARHRARDGFPAGGGLIALALLASAIAIGAYPIVRRITGRLEALQASVDELGEGDLGARVQVEGNDEVARLARSFNRAAGRIEQLVGSQKNLLASVSHELRTPLARLRVAIELLSGDERPELRQRIERDIGELDALIGELLLASRLDTGVGLEHKESVDLLALFAEEAIHTGAEVSGEAIAVLGDPRMLRRLVRNLLENAHRHAAGSAVEARVTRSEDGAARLRVDDRGPGVPEAERERIFEPFYRSASSTTPSDSGAGLGLALVRQIARRHGGEARCLPRAGGGSSFEVVLPAS